MLSAWQDHGSFPNTGPGDCPRPANLVAVNILRRIGQAITRLNRRLAAGSTGRAGRDVSMLQSAEREQFEARKDEESE
jgi:hypothetical protein